MKKFPLFIFCFAIIIIQLSILGAFFRSERVPNLVLALVVSLVVYRGIDEFLGWIIFCGFLVGIGSGWILGSDALLFIILAFLIDRLNSFSDIKSRRLLFYPGLAMIYATSSVLLDWLAFWLATAEKYFTKAGDIKYHVDYFSADYFIKIIFTIIGGFAIYYFIRKLRVPNVSRVFQQ